MKTNNVNGGIDKVINITSDKLNENLFEYLDLAINHNCKISVNTKNGNAVIISEDEYESLIETTQILSVPNMKEKIIEGINTPIKDCEDIKL